MTLVATPFPYLQTGGCPLRFAPPPSPCPLRGPSAGTFGGYFAGVLPLRGRCRDAKTRAEQEHGRLNLALKNPHQQEQYTSV
jgi:hypothetical protein